MRKRRAQGQQAAASGAFLWVFLYAFRSPLWRGLDNLSRLPADHAGKALKWLAFQWLKCVDRRGFSALAFCISFVALLHSVIHIPILLWVYSTHFKACFSGDWSNPIAAPSNVCQKPATAAYSAA